MNRRRVDVVKYRAEWADLFIKEKLLLESIFKPVEVEIHHIGSTAVAGLSAKPIIDILLAADRLEQVEKASPELEAAGYKAKGENGLQGRRYFQKNDGAGVRKVHLHSYEKGNKEVYRHLVFRDYLRNHPNDAERYTKLKEMAAVKFVYDIESYMDEKSPLVKEIEQKALQWRPE